MIDPDKLLELATLRQCEGSVTLGFPLMMQIVDDLSALQQLFETLERIRPAQCSTADADTWRAACRAELPSEPPPEDT